jgi:hypothetical protein
MIVKGEECLGGGPEEVKGRKKRVTVNIIEVQ